MVVLVEGEVEDGLVAHLLAVLLVQVVPDLHGGLQRVLEPAEVVVLETSCELTLRTRSSVYQSDETVYNSKTNLYIFLTDGSSRHLDGWFIQSVIMESFCM